MARLHAHRSWPDGVWRLAATLARMVRLRNTCRWDRPGLAKADYGASRTLIASTVSVPAARLTNQLATHHFGFADPRRGRCFQEVSRSARTSHGPKPLKTSCSHASRQAALWGTGRLNHTNRSAFRGDSAAIPGGAVRAGKRGDAARHAPGSLSPPSHEPRGQPAFS